MWFWNAGLSFKRMLYNYFTGLRNLGIMQQICAPLSLAVHLIGGFADSGERYGTGDCAETKLWSSGQSWRTEGACEKGQHNRAISHILKILFFRPVAAAASSEAELAPKREAAPGEATALEALLRGDSLLEKKNSLCKEEETLLEIQVLYSYFAQCDAFWRNVWFGCRQKLGICCHSRFFFSLSTCI